MTMNPISRADAVIAGQTHYFTGRPCVRGHVGPRFVSTGNCVECGSHRAKAFAGIARQQKIIQLRPDAHEFVIFQIHPDDVETMRKSLDWLNDQRGRPPCPRPQQAAPNNIAAAPAGPDTRTEFERLLDMHTGRFDLATIRRLAAQSVPPIPEVYSPGRSAPDIDPQGLAAKLRANLERDGYAEDER